MSLLGRMSKNTSKRTDFPITCSDFGQLVLTPRDEPLKKSLAHTDSSSDFSSYHSPHVSRSRSSLFDESNDSDDISISQKGRQYIDRISSGHSISVSSRSNGFGSRSNSISSNLNESQSHAEENEVCSFRTRVKKDGQPIALPKNEDDGNYYDPKYGRLEEGYGKSS